MICRYTPIHGWVYGLVVEWVGGVMGGSGQITKNLKMLTESR